MTFLALALLSYTQTDPSPSTAAAGDRIANWMGRPGAVVADRVLLEDVLVEAGAQVRTAVVDRGARIGRGAQVGAAPAGTRLTDEAIALVGQDSVVGGGARVEAGARLEPGTRV